MLHIPCAHLVTRKPSIATCVVQVPPTNTSKTDHTRVENKECWVIMEYRAHNEVCVANSLTQDIRRWTAYSREMLAAALLPWWTSCTSSGRRPENHEIAARLQPYLKREVTANSPPVTGVAKKLAQFHHVGKGASPPPQPPHPARSSSAHACAQRAP